MTRGLTIDKADLRALSRAKREALATAGGANAAEALSRHTVDNVKIPDGAVIAGYWPMGCEIDPRPLMAVLRAREHRLCLPVVEARDAPLIFRSWQPGAALVDAVYGTSVPAPDQEIMTPAVLLVPLLAFDRAGHRLGYGGGYYDHTLAALSDQRPLAIGVAYAFQEVDDVPHGAHDRRLDWIVTDRSAVRCR